MKRITLQKLFKYRAGKLYNRNDRGGGAKAGDEAGSCAKDGYRHVRVDRKDYFTHRVIWIMAYGAICANLQIDHINGNRDDNRLKNLRLVTLQENSWNKIKVKGYSWCEPLGKWKAEIKVNGKSIYLGLFEKEGDARRSYLEAKKIYHKI